MQQPLAFISQQLHLGCVYAAQKLGVHAPRTSPSTKSNAIMSSQHSARLSNPGNVGTMLPEIKQLSLQCQIDSNLLREDTSCSTSSLALEDRVQIASDFSDKQKTHNLLFLTSFCKGVSKRIAYF